MTSGGPHVEVTLQYSGRNPATWYKLCNFISGSEFKAGWLGGVRWTRSEESGGLLFNVAAEHPACPRCALLFNVAVECLARPEHIGCSLPPLVSE